MVKFLKMTNQNIFGYNFRRLRKAKGWSPAEAAEKGAVSENYIGGVETGHKSFGRKAQLKWARIFGVNYMEFHKPVGVQATDLPTHRVPLISWVRAGSLHEPIDIYQAGSAEEWIASNASGPNAFALRVVGKSMFPEFLEGDIIVVDPGIEPASGDYAIVKVNDEVTFKQIHFYLNKIVLVPINKDGYEPMEIVRDDGFKVQIIGKVVEQIRRR